MSSPVTITGYGTAFEATVSWQVYRDGEMVDRGLHPGRRQRRVRRVHRHRRPGARHLRDPGLRVLRRGRLARCTSTPRPSPSSSRGRQPPAAGAGAARRPGRRCRRSRSAARSARAGTPSPPAADQHGQLLGAEPALGADDHARPRRRPAAASVAQRLVASSCSTTPAAARRSRSTTSRVPASSVTTGNLARRDCLAAACAVVRHRSQRLLAAPVAPPGHAPRRRPRHDLVDADLGHRLDGGLAAVALGQRLHDDQPRRRRRLDRRPWPRRPRRTSCRPPSRPRRRARRPRAVDQLDRLTGAQPHARWRRAGPRPVDR